MWTHVSRQIQDTGTSSPMSWIHRLAHRPNVTPFHPQYPRTVLAFRLLDRFAAASPIHKLAFLRPALEGCLKHLNLVPPLPSVRFPDSVRGARVKTANVTWSKDLVVLAHAYCPAGQMEIVRSARIRFWGKLTKYVSSIYTWYPGYPYIVTLLMISI